MIILMLALTITGIAFLNAGVMEYRLAKREDYKNKAFYIAEGGLERTIWNLKQDFVNGSEDWTDGTINEISVDDTPTDGWRVLGYAETSLGAGSYEVKVKYVDKDEIWVKSTGTVKDIPKTVQMYVRIENVFPWNNAVFAGIGTAAGTVIEGNSLIHGSVLILGAETESDAIAMDTTGAAGIRNNYEGMPDGSGGTVNLVDKVPPLPTTAFNGEWVDSLEAKLRVKRGKTGLSGTATVGQPDGGGNSFKETMDGVYASDGYGGNQGANNVYSDNGTGNPYDLADIVQFPSLKLDYVDPITGETTPGYTYLHWLADNSRHISQNEISSNITDFDYPFDGKGSINWDQSEGKLTVDGIVWVEANSLDLGKKDKTIEYDGSGTIVVVKYGSDEIGGDIQVHGDLITEGMDNGPGGTQGFPNNALGLITDNLYLATGAGESQLTMTGAFFAEDQIVSAKQNEIGGTFLSNNFDMGMNVPRIYQVPELADNLPPGMPGGTPIWHIITSQWSEQ